MQAISFDSVIDGDKIHIPEKLIGNIGASVRVIIFPNDTISSERKPATLEDFTDLKIPTKGWKFNRDEANERR
jgi:hypothetical protein